MSAVEYQDEVFMRRAIELARRGWGATNPNPMVGAVIVEAGGWDERAGLANPSPRSIIAFRIVAEGWHERDGGPHAERVALTALGRAPAADATLYVTLEPCSTPGRTGACTEAILAAGIRRVVVGAIDPNPAHAGRGLEILRAAGVEVRSGVLERDCADLNLIFNHWIVRGTPLLAAKAAVTLDGKIATRSGDSRWITNELSRADVHRWRRLFPGIAVGAQTVLADDPSLTSRRPGEPEWCPWRFVFDGQLRTVVDRAMPRIYTDAHHARTIVVTTQHGGSGYVRKLERMGVLVWTLESATPQATFSSFRQRCAAEGIAGVYFEGGAHLLSGLLRERETDYLFIYRAPILLADEKAHGIFRGLRPDKLAEAVRLADTRHEVFGDDELLRGRVVYPEKIQLDETASGLG
jgi:diaminohydroxyphosphoribosylaminopyrimidine deaminase/5-amino-6-(5-phosphoribosylamino)uracil reductase